MDRRGFESMVRGYHESVIATLFRPLTLELRSRPPSCFPAKYLSLNSNKIVLQMLSYCTASSEGEAM